MHKVYELTPHHVLPDLTMQYIYSISFRLANATLYMVTSHCTLVIGGTNVVLYHWLVKIII